MVAGFPDKSEKLVQLRSAWRGYIFAALVVGDASDRSESVFVSSDDGRRRGKTRIPSEDWKEENAGAVWRGPLSGDDAVGWRRLGPAGASLRPGRSDSPDGRFWMFYEDFARVFTDVCVVFLPEQPSS